MMGVQKMILKNSLARKTQMPCIVIDIHHRILPAQFHKLYIQVHFCLHLVILESELLLFSKIDDQIVTRFQ